MRRKKAIMVIGLVTVVILGTFAYLIMSRQMTVPFLYRVKPGNRYTIATAWTDTPLFVDSSDMKPLKWECFDQHPTCVFMADPFVVRNGNDFYVFYEEMSSKMNSTWGDIAVLHSADLEHWERLGVAIDEPFHLSFPNVFEYEGDWYMLPESTAIKELRLYKATEFPLKWNYCVTLVNDDYCADAALLQQDSLWFLLYKSSKGLRLCYSENLFFGWEEHPMTPIRVEDGEQETRPAGGFINYEDSIYYVVQRHDGHYGTSVVAYRIDSLTTMFFDDYRLSCNPIVEAHGGGWARDGMHQWSSVFVPEKGRYFCVMDGNKIDDETEWGWDWKNLPKFRLRNKESK